MSKINVGKTLSIPSSVVNGLRQGCCMSATFVKLYAKKAQSKLKRNTMEWT